MDQEAIVKLILAQAQENTKRYGVALVYRNISGDTLQIDFITTKPLIPATVDNFKGMVLATFKNQKSDCGIQKIEILNVSAEAEYRDPGRQPLKESPLFKSLRSE